MKQINAMMVVNCVLSENIHYNKGSGSQKQTVLKDSVKLNCNFQMVQIFYCFITLTVFTEMTII